MVTLTLAQSKIRVSTAVLAFRVKRVPHVIVQGLTSLETIANLVSQLVDSFFTALSYLLVERKCFRVCAFFKTAQSL